MKKNIIIIVSVFLLIIPRLGFAQKRQAVGVKSKEKYKQIERINRVVSYLNKNEYQKVVSILKNDLIGPNTYKQQHILNELADIYSYNLLDLEKAIEIDTKILDLGVLADIKYYTLHKTGAHYFIRKNRPENIILNSVVYRDNYINITSKSIINRAHKRLNQNKKLLEGNKSKSNKKNGIQKLEAGITQIQKDLAGAYKGTKNYDRLFSRLLRYEFEAYLKSNKNKKYIKNYSPFLDGTMSLSRVYFKEISFLKLSEYLNVAYSIEKNSTYLELSFLAINKPYLNMRQEVNKISYSVLINKTIDVIVTDSYNNQNFANFLYFSSLNKARVLAEKSLSKGNNNNLFVFDSYANLQQKKKKFAAFLKDKIQKHNYLDVYTQNSFSKERASLKVNKREETNLVTLRESTRGYDPNTTKRDSVIIYKKPLALYATKILGNKISVTKVSGDLLVELIEKTTQFNNDLKGGYLSNTYFEDYKSYFLDFLELNDFVSRLTDDIYVSVNGEFANAPISYLLGKTAIRNLNMFTFSDVNAKNKLTPDNISILGLFNPNPIGVSNLPAAEKEYDIIDSIFPKANTLLFKADMATKEILKESLNKPINIFHFSGHGHNNPKNPNMTGLEFLGHTKAKPNLLTLNEMKSDKYQNIKNKELVFLAACQVGVSKNNKKNDSEISGLIRPLLANKNAILSLWNVDDESTAKFVELFYSALKESGDIHDAFKKSVGKMEYMYKENINYYAPFYIINTGKDYANYKQLNKSN
jgi:hypothetical protein